MFANPVEACIVASYSHPFKMNLIVHYVFPIFVDIPVIFHPLKVKYRCIFWWWLVWHWNCFFSFYLLLLGHVGDNRTFFLVISVLQKIVSPYLVSLRKKLFWINEITRASMQDFVFPPSVKKYDFLHKFLLVQVLYHNEKRSFLPPFVLLIHSNILNHELLSRWSLSSTSRWFQRGRHLRWQGSKLARRYPS